jgi:hypothetical protein
VNTESQAPGVVGDATKLKSKPQVITSFNIGKSIAWLFIGLPWLFWALIRDCKDYWSEMYEEKEGYDEEKEQTKV